MERSGSGSPLKEALDGLRRDGYSISADRFARLKPFGIHTTGSRGSLPRVITSEHLERLRFLLEVDRRFGFGRDYDGLAFQLAFAGYPVVLWDRVQAAVYKRPKTTLTHLNVMIHKIAGEAGTYLDAREVERAAKNLASRYIPKSARQAAAHMAVAHQALTAVFAILLRVMYLDAVFSAADIRRVLLMTEFPISDVDSVAGPFADSLNSANIPGLLRFDAKNRLMAAMQTSEIDAHVWQAAFSQAHRMAPLYRSLMRLAYPDFDHGLDMRFPDLGTLPTGTASDLKFVHVIHTGLVGLAFMGRSDPRMLEGITACGDGSPLLSQLLRDLARLKEQIPMVLRLKHGN